MAASAAVYHRSIIFSERIERVIEHAIKEKSTYRLMLLRNINRNI